MRLTPYSPSGGPSLLAPALAFALLFLSQAVVTAKTYFVDFTSGSNSNSGLSEGSAWKHCPGDASASGVPAATLLQAGDVIRFKGGVRYQGTIGLLWSGSASAGRITYDGGSWGAQRAIITTAAAVPENAVEREIRGCVGKVIHFVASSTEKKKCKTSHWTGGRRSQKHTFAPP